MSAQKTLSQLSFAIIALFIAALPCFAQTESATARTESRVSSSTSVIQIASVNNVRRSGLYRWDSAAAAEAEPGKQSTFSAAAFMQAVNEPASLQTRSSSSTPTMVIDFDTTKFDAEKPDSTRRITFVPSKGQKIPQ